ncbi:tryptophan halogenase family protein [Teredinibacter purpureus]|uniref:tryptophan halogenase family protein n=1 Tax=Teredinibacter purpureus TaxID=2731756 RepID=UPI0005F85B62|nr:tryptophan halogenase family protein [Teredinibacter purpureus]
METKPIKNIVIAGGGTAGWIAAVALSKKLSGAVSSITLVESDDIGTVGVGEATIPPIRVFHKLMQIDEQEFMRETDATFKLGISFEGWKNIGADYIHSFGKTGKEAWLAEFVHFWLRAKEKGFAGDFGDYCYELQAAKQNKFGLSPGADINYAYHLDATKYAKYLRKISESHGVKRVEGKISSVNQDASTGFINSLQLDSGTLIEGDLFIDCTGFSGLLIEKTLHTGYEDWSHWLPCDSAVAMQTELTEPAIPYTRSVAHRAGWRWKIPLQHRVGNGLVYSRQHMSDESAREKILSDVNGKPLNDPRVIRFRTGCRRKNWNKNCIALGLSSGFIEPLESTSIHLFIMGVTRLMQMFPFAGVHDSVVEEFNTQSRKELEMVRDFIILHYKVTNRTDSSFWSYCKNMDVPSSLARRIEVFQEAALAFQREGELFRVDSWSQVMLGQGIMPSHYHRIADQMSDKELKRFLETMKFGIDNAVDKLPLHHNFIEQYCKTKPH